MRSPMPALVRNGPPDRIRALSDRTVRLATAEAALSATGQASCRIRHDGLAFTQRRPPHVGLDQRRIDHGTGLDDPAALPEPGIRRHEHCFRQPRLGQIDPQARPGRGIRHRILQTRPAGTAASSADPPVLPPDHDPTAATTAREAGLSAAPAAGGSQPARSARGAVAARGPRPVPNYLRPDPLQPRVAAQGCRQQSFNQARLTYRLAHIRPPPVLRPRHRIMRKGRMPGVCGSLPRIARGGAPVTHRSAVLGLATAPDCDPRSGHAAAAAGLGQGCGGLRHRGIRAASDATRRATPPWLRPAGLGMAGGAGAGAGGQPALPRAACPPGHPSTRTRQRCPP